MRLDIPYNNTINKFSCKMEEIWKSRRQVSDLSSASDYSTSNGSSCKDRPRSVRCPPKPKPGWVSGLTRTRLTQSKTSLSGCRSPSTGTAGRPRSQAGSRPPSAPQPGPPLPASNKDRPPPPPSRYLRSPPKPALNGRAWLGKCKAGPEGDKGAGARRISVQPAPRPQPEPPSARPLKPAPAPTRPWLSKSKTNLSATSGPPQRPPSQNGGRVPPPPAKNPVKSTSSSLSNIPPHKQQRIEVGSSRPPISSSSFRNPTAASVAKVQPPPHANSNKTSALSSLREVQALRLEFGRERECTREELSSVLKKHEQELKDQAANHDSAIAELKESLRLEFGRERECTKEELGSLVRKHELDLKEQSSHYDSTITELKEQHEAELAELGRQHVEELQRAKSSYALNIELLKEAQAAQGDEELQRLQAAHRLNIQEIQERTTEKHKAELDRLLSNHRLDLDLLRQAQAEQMTLYTKQTPYEVLHKEIQSLEVVVEIRNQEVKDLRRELIEFKELSQHLAEVKDQNSALQAKVEDLEAQLAKSRSDKGKLLQKCTSMEESMSHVVTENDRLHLYNEELHWRIETLKSSELHDSESNGSMSKSAIELSSGPFSDTECST